MTIKYIKKADKTAASDELETRQRVQDILKDIGWTDLEIDNLKGIMPDEDDWASAFDKDTLPKELSGLKQFTFILKEEQIEEILKILKTIDKDKNIALYKIITEK